MCFKFRKLEVFDGLVKRVLLRITDHTQVDAIDINSRICQHFNVVLESNAY